MVKKNDLGHMPDKCPRVTEEMLFGTYDGNTLVVLQQKCYIMDMIRMPRQCCEKILNFYHIANALNTGLKSISAFCKWQIEPRYVGAHLKCSRQVLAVLKSNVTFTTFLQRPRHKPNVTWALPELCWVAN